MSTTVSHVIAQTPCIWLEVDEQAHVRDVLEEAKDIAIREETMVVLVIPTDGRVLQVTAESDIERMLTRYNDRFNCSWLIR